MKLGNTLQSGASCLGSHLSSRMMQVQSDLTVRCLELLNLPEEQPCFILDVGYATIPMIFINQLWFWLERRRDHRRWSFLGWNGHKQRYDRWAAFATLSVDVALEREVEGDLVLQDMGQGVPFRPGTFDGVIR